MAIAHGSVFIAAAAFSHPQSMSHNHQPSALSHGVVTVIALGDSTTAGTPGFTSPIEAPPNGVGNVQSQYAYWLMKTHPDWRVLNRGVNGERSDQVRTRFERDLRDLIEERRRGRDGPVVVVIVAGVNDIYQGRGADLVEHELEVMYDAARGARIPVVAGTIIPFNTATDDQNRRMHAVNAWIRQYAQSHSGVAYCDTRAAVAAPGHPDRLVSSPDDLHPSPDGYRLMALALEPAIAQLIAGDGWSRLDPVR